jgi:hypothetical protein
MHSNQRLWLSWSRGEIDDDAAQAAHARKRAWLEALPARQQNEPAGLSESRRGTGPREKVFGPGRCVPLDRGRSPGRPCRA